MKNNKGWKFQYHKAISDYSLTNAERATLTAIWDYADANTGKCYPTDAQINEKCGRSRNAKLSDHKKKFVELGLLTIGGHGRKSVYYLNKSVKPISKSVSESVSQSSQVSNSDGQVSNHDGVSQSSLLTNRSSNRSSNTPYREPRVKRELLKEEIDKAKHYTSPDWKPGAPVSNSFPDEVKEAEMRFFFLISKGLQDDTTFGEVRNWFVEWVRDYKDEVSLTTWCFLNFNSKVSDLTAYQYYAKKNKTYALYKDYEVRAGFVPGKEHWSAVVPEISKRLVARGKEVVLL